MQPHDHSDPSSGTDLNPVDGVYLGEDKRYLLDKRGGRVVFVDTLEDNEAYIPEGFDGDITSAEPDEGLIKKMVRVEVEQRASEVEDSAQSKAEEVIESFSIELDDIPTPDSDELLYLSTEGGEVQWKTVEHPRSQNTVPEDFRASGISLGTDETYTIARFTPPEGYELDIVRAGVRDSNGDTAPGLRVEVFDHTNEEQLFSTELDYSINPATVDVGGKDVEIRVVNKHVSELDGISSNITGEIA